MTELETASPPAVERHPDLFTAERAAAYLNLPNVRAFNRRRRAHQVNGERFGTVWMYSRGQLDALKKMIFGEELSQRQQRGRS